MAGFGAAHRLHAEGIRPVMYDKNAYSGGHTASFRGAEGFMFDVGPHISFTKDPRVQQLFADSVDQKFETIPIVLNNYWRGHWPLHPVQLHLYGLPEATVRESIKDFVDASHAPDKPIDNYEDWLLASFGKSFAESFPMQYTRKYHTTDARNLSTDWLGPRIYRPTLDEVLRGALSPSAAHSHYITHFRYPSAGGFQCYLRKFMPMGEIRLDHEVVRIDPRQRTIAFRNGTIDRYDRLVSSVALPDLVAMIDGAPTDVIDASKRLACTTCVLVNLGIDRADLSAAHMTYFYDEDVCFSRLGFPHMLSARNAPEGMGNIQAEVYFSDKYKPFTGSADDWIDPVIRDLRRCGVLRETDRVVSKGSMLLRYANVIFDLERKAALATVHGYLDEIGIAYCGRYGDWGYMWTDESFISGERAVERALADDRRVAAPAS